MILRFYQQEIEFFKDKHKIIDVPILSQTESEKEQIIKELGQENYDKYFKWELPQHEVCVNGFWMAKYPVTVGQFRQFVEATSYQTDAEGFEKGWEN